VPHRRHELGFLVQACQRGAGKRHQLLLLLLVLLLRVLCLRVALLPPRVLPAAGLVAALPPIRPLQPHEDLDGHRGLVQAAQVHLQQLPRLPRLHASITSRDYGGLQQASTF
jgi:hypothetical protein